MRDPHVEQLVYRLQPHESVTFESPPAVAWQTEEFGAVLDGDELVVKPKDHYPSEQSARDLIEPHLRSWEIADAVSRSGVQAMSFEFQRADVVDRAPPVCGEVMVCEPGVITFKVNPVHCHHVRREYPAPPGRFMATTEVLALWNRFNDHDAGGEPLLSMAYFCLSYLEKRFARPPAKKRESLSDALNIDIDVLNKLGEITSTRGDMATARKDGDGVPVTATEESWVREAILRMIGQLGEFEGDTRRPPSSRLNMSDLPSFA